MLQRGRPFLDPHLQHRQGLLQRFLGLLLLCLEALLVQNASELGPVPLRPLAETPPDAFERVLAVNLLGPFRLGQAVGGLSVVDWVDGAPIVEVVNTVLYSRP